MGFSPEAIAEVRAQAASAEADAGLQIHPDNVVAVRWFLALQTQWRWVSQSTMSASRLIRTGLDYGVKDTVAASLGLTPDADDFARLRHLEIEALNAWQEALKS